MRFQNSNFKSPTGFTLLEVVVAMTIVRVRARQRLVACQPPQRAGGAAAVEAIKAQARDVEAKEEIASVASISAGDPEIGATIADALDKVGKDGVITVEESNTFGMELEFTEGMRFDKGYISPYFITDPERMEAVLEDPLILIANSKIGAVHSLLTDDFEYACLSQQADVAIHSGLRDVWQARDQVGGGARHPT